MRMISRKRVKPAVPLVRRRERRHVQLEGDQIDVVDISLHDQEPAHADYRNGQHAEEKLDRGEELRHDAVIIVLDVFIILVRLAEFFDFLVLIGERLCHADAGKARFNRRVDVRLPGLDLAGGEHHPAAQAENDGHRDGDNNRHDNRQPPLDGKHDHQRAGNRQERNADILRTVMRQLRHVEQVGRQAAHEMTGAVLIVKIKRQLFKMRKQIAANIGLDAHAEGVSPVGDDILQTRAHRVNADHNADQHKKRGVRLFRQQIMQRPAGENRINQVDDGNERRTDHIEDKQFSVRLEIGQENGKTVLFLVISGCHARFPLSSY